MVIIVTTIVAMVMAMTIKETQFFCAHFYTCAPPIHRQVATAATAATAATTASELKRTA